MLISSRSAACQRSAADVLSRQATRELPASEPLSSWSQSPSQCQVQRTTSKPPTMSTDSSPVGEIVPKGKVLQPIPYEVLRKIASLIDRPTAHALARSCKSLRDAGESRIWESVNLRHGVPSTWLVSQTRGQIVADADLVRERAGGGRQRCGRSDITPREAV
jgi:hypothetical protein